MTAAIDANTFINKMINEIFFNYGTSWNLHLYGVHLQKKYYNGEGPFRLGLDMTEYLRYVITNMQNTNLIK